MSRRVVVESHGMTRQPSAPFNPLTYTLWDPSDGMVDTTQWQTTCQTCSEDHRSNGYHDATVFFHLHGKHGHSVEMTSLDADQIAN